MNPKKIFKCKNALPVIFLFLGIVLFACNSNDVGTSVSSIPEPASEDNPVVMSDGNAPSAQAGTPQPGSEDFNLADVISSATPSAIPGEFSKPLDETHGSGDMSGWGKSTCLDQGCHPVNHDARYTESNCATCHGFNGSPNIPEDHNLSHDDGIHAECVNEACHTDSHTGQNFQSPVDCKACHRLAQTDTPSFTEEYDVVVIGAGGAGLSTAAILSRAGLKVLVIEKHYKVGGMFGKFHRGDYTFEIGLYGEVLSEISMVLGMLGKHDVEEVMYSPFYARSYYLADDRTLDIPANPWEYKEVLKEQFPDEEDQQSIDDIFEQLIFMWGTPVHLFDSTQDFFDRYTDNVKLVNILGDVAIHMGVPLDEFIAPLFMFLFNGFHVGGYTYPPGTSQHFADSFAEIILEEGNRIELNTLATKIVVDDDTATEVWTNHGGRYRAKHIVSTANAELTFLKLVGEDYLPEALITALKGDENGEGKLKITEPIVNIYLGVDKDYTDAFAEGSMIINVVPTYDPNENYNAILDCTVEKTRYGIANYSIISPDAAPEGKNTICIGGQLSYDCPDGEQWFVGDYERYNEYKYQIATSYVDRVSALPGFSDLWDHIEVMEVCSPHTTEGYTFSTRGAHVGYGFANDQLLNITRTYGIATPIKNLYQTGQWSSGGGAPLVIIGGMLTSSVIIAKDPGAADIVDFIVDGFNSSMYTWYKAFERVIIRGSYY